MSTSNTKNMNEEIQIRKPVRDSYIKNGHHKKFQRKSYILIDQTLGCKAKVIDGKCVVQPNQTYEKFNFKKTNARKYHYSCGGYGGKCSMCSDNDYSQMKQFRKVYIGTQNNDFAIKVDRARVNI